MYLPEEIQSQNDLKRSRPQHVEEGSEVHEPLGIHGHEVHYLAHCGWALGSICNYQRLWKEKKHDAYESVPATRLALRSGTSAREQWGSADLPVNGSYDGRAHVHAGDKAVVEVSVQDEGLQHRREEHEEGQWVAPPVGGAVLFGKRNQHSGRAISRERGK